MNFSQFLELSTQKYPDKTALVVGDRRLTYRQMANRAERFSSALYHLGFRHGDCLGLSAQNCLEYPEIIFGCARIGVVSVLLNWRLSIDEQLKLLERNHVKGLILQLATPEKDLELCAAVPADIPLFSLRDLPGHTSYNSLLDMDVPTVPAAHLAEEEILLHIHTSGTTGVPKVVLYSHGGFTKAVLTYLYQQAVTSTTITQQMTQMFHSACVSMFGCIAAGATVIALDHFKIDEYLSTIQTERTTRLALIPSILRHIVQYPHLDQYDLSSVKEIAYSTAPMPPKLIKEAMNVLPCKYYTTYGMTEMGPIVTALGPEEHEAGQLFSVGRPIVGADVRIVAPDGSVCPAGEPGEVTVRGFSMMKGYLDMPQATANAIQDGWFHTGDVGYLDENGYLYLKGRKNNMIITGGENVYPAEIENVLTAFCEDVTECVVYGVPDETWGEIVVASVVLAPGSTQTSDSIRKLCARKLANYQVPKKIFIEDTPLPRNQVGKVMPRLLVDRYVASMQSETK